MNLTRMERATEVAYFRDDAGTWFAAEVVRARRWSPELLVPVDVLHADVRIVFLDAPEGATGDGGCPLPGWLRVLPSAAEREPRHVVAAALDGWRDSPSHRPAGAPAEAYLVAGFQALCPPHAPCEAGPGMRDALRTFLAGRPGDLGRLALEPDDSVNRLLRIGWPAPEGFRDEILRQRIHDEGGRGVLRLLSFLERAEVAPEAEEHAALGLERARLLSRLAPIAYFDAPSDFDRAAALALDWRERYQRAYRTHYRLVLEAARDVVLETTEAAALLPELEAMNDDASPIASDPARRLRDALDGLGRLPEGPDERAPQTAGVVLGRMPRAVGEARLSAAAVLAAVEVHRRRRAR